MPFILFGLISCTGYTGNKTAPNTQGVDSVAVLKGGIDSIQQLLNGKLTELEVFLQEKRTEVVARSDGYLDDLQDQYEEKTAYIEQHYSQLTEASKKRYEKLKQDFKKLMREKSAAHSQVPDSSGAM